VDIFGAGKAFIEREGRIVERRLAAALFDGAEAEGVVAAVGAYRNADGGFGHGFEPDTRCPASLPICVEAALDVLWEVRSDAYVAQACDWLATTATPEGAVSLASPIIEQYPRAEHMTEWTYEPSLNPTAGLAGRLHRAGVRHAWLDRASEWTFNALATGFGEDSHALLGVSLFLVHVPDRERASTISAKVPGWLADAKWFLADASAEGYGVTPLHFAPTPDSPWRSLFTDAQIEGHLDRLAGMQQPDGGWAITWEPPSAASALDWRGIETLRALRVLRAYGRC
jgi:hypothetical protein